MYGTNHPLAIPRVSLAYDLIRSFGAISEPEYLPAREATELELEWFHAPEYVAAMSHAEALGRVTNGQRKQYRVGTAENPYFERFFSTPATAAGASIQAAEQVIAGRIGFNPAGGMHHARADHARGFCYFNDPVLGILRLRHEGWRVMYVDIDAHHGDGVEDAFRDDARVLTMSLHMDTAYAYPFHGGRIEDCGSSAGGFTTINLPLPRGTHDAEYRLIFDTLWPRVVEKFRPDAVVLQAGTDMIAGDPLGKFRMSTQCFLEMSDKVMRAAPRHDGTPRLLVTGGGGYHPLLVARAWAGLWGVLSGRELPEAIPPEGAGVLRAVGWDRDEDGDENSRLFASRLDAVATLPVRPEVERLVDDALHHPYLR
jgi:acetoin utilization protein AcuC